MSAHGFPPALRLRKRREFDAVFRDGTRASDAVLAVHALPNGGADPRLGLAVGKAVGGSVVRNRVKRRLREAFRLHREELPPGHDLVVIPRPESAPDRTLEEWVLSLVAVARRAAERHRNGGGGRRRRDGIPPGGRGRRVAEDGTA